MRSPFFQWVTANAGPQRTPALCDKTVTEGFYGFGQQPVDAPPFTLLEGRVAPAHSFFHLGELVEYDPTEDIFTSVKDERAQGYIVGRFG